MASTIASVLAVAFVLGICVFAVVQGRMRLREERRFKDLGPRKVCDQYWEALRRNETPIPYRRYAEAVTMLPEDQEGLLDWARARLTSPVYEARATAADVIGGCCENEQVPPELAAVLIDELSAVIRRPIEEDPKEKEAIEAAIAAVGEIKHAYGIRILAEVLNASTEPLSDEEIGEAAAYALGQLVKQDFHNDGDPIRDAQTWLIDHPEAVS